MDFRCELNADTLRIHLGEHKGTYPAWWREIRIEIYGWSPSKRRARLNGGNIEATMDVSPGKVALTIPDNGRGEVLDLE
jgi:alpha-glucosidase